jgi:hypothetical protein
MSLGNMQRPSRPRLVRRVNWMIFPWSVKVYDARIIISGSDDAKTSLGSGSFEVIFGQLHGQTPSFGECLALAREIVEGLNAQAAEDDTAGSDRKV